jgi:hypothetical protein
MIARMTAPLGEDGEAGHESRLESLPLKGPVADEERADDVRAPVRVVEGDGVRGRVGEKVLNLDAEAADESVGKAPQEEEDGHLGQPCRQTRAHRTSSATTPPWRLTG